MTEPCPRSAQHSSIPGILKERHEPDGANAP